MECNENLLERSAQGLVATASPAILPVHLNHPVLSPKGLIEFGAV